MVIQRLKCPKPHIQNCMFYVWVGELQWDFRCATEDVGLAKVQMVIINKLTFQLTDFLGEVISSYSVNWEILSCGTWRFSTVNIVVFYIYIYIHTWICIYPFALICQIIFSVTVLLSHSMLRDKLVMYLNTVFSTNNPFELQQWYWYEVLTFIILCSLLSVRNCINHSTDLWKKIHSYKSFHCLKKMI